MRLFADQRSENPECAHAGFRTESKIFREDHTWIWYLWSQGTIREDAIQYVYSWSKYRLFLFFYKEYQCYIDV